MKKKLLQAEKNNRFQRNQQISDLSRESQARNWQQFRKLETISKTNDTMLRKTKNTVNELKTQREKYLNIINKRNYEDKYPKPTFLKDHQHNNPNSFYLQVLGSRGAGKSTFLNRIFRETGLRKI